MAYHYFLMGTQLVREAKVLERHSVEPSPPFPPKVIMQKSNLLQHLKSAKNP
jgi:hypothetical protein